MKEKNIMTVAFIGFTLFTSFIAYNVYVNDYTKNADGFVSPDLQSSFIALVSATISLVILAGISYKYGEREIGKNRKIQSIGLTLTLIACVGLFYGFAVYTVEYSGRFGGCFGHFNVSINQPTIIGNSCKYTNMEITIVRPKMGYNLLEIESFKINGEDYLSSMHRSHYFGGGPFTKYSSQSAVEIPEINLKIRIIDNTNSSAIVEIQRYS